MSMRSQRQIAFYVEPELKKALRERASREETTLQHLCEQGVAQLIFQGDQPQFSWWPHEREKEIVALFLSIWRGNGKHRAVIATMIDLYREAPE